MLHASVLKSETSASIRLRLHVSLYDCDEFENRLITDLRNCLRNEQFAIEQTHQIQFPKSVETMSGMDQLSRALDSILNPRAHEFRVRIGVKIRSHSVSEILLPGALVNVVIYVIIYSKAVLHVALPLTCETRSNLPTVCQTVSCLHFLIARSRKLKTYTLYKPVQLKNMSRALKREGGGGEMEIKREKN